MKELHTTKPLVLGIIGLPGAGKSRFAGEFSVMFGAPIIELDLLQRTVFGSGPVSKDHEAGIKRLYSSLVEAQAKTHHTFIIDGSLNTYAARNEIRTLAKKYGYDVMLLWIQTSETVARDRATRAHKDSTNTILTPAEFDRAVSTFESPRSNENHIVTSGQRTFNSQVRPILSRLAEVHESKLQSPRPVQRDTQPKRDGTERPPRRNIFIR